MAPSDRRTLEAALAEAEARAADAPGDLASMRRRAGLLAALGRADAAKAAYLEILAVDPDDFATLNDFGVLLHETQYLAAARTLFTRAVERHPAEPLGHVNLANLMMYEDELDLARVHYETALRLDPGHAAAHQRLSALLHELGDLEGMQRHRRLGFAAQPMETLPCLGEGEPARLLVLTSTPAGDIAWRKLVDRQAFAITTLAAAFIDPAAPLPPHDLVFNAIGDADLSGGDLRAAEILLAGTKAPVINPPARVAPTGRMANARRLAALPGVVTPTIRLMSRAALAEADHVDGFGFPFLLRSPGFHTGRHFVEVRTPADLARAALELPGDELMVIQRLDARGPDGRARKHRVMLIGGELYPLHLAISDHWKVHYATGGMAGAPALQAEEARFLTDMPGALGAPAVAALKAIQGALGLDYAGVDFALGPDGELLLFEANAVMNIIPPGPDPQWDYRRPAINAALEAAREMLRRKAAAAPAR
jgi:hypothetical protein